MLFSGSRHLAADDIHILERAATVAALAITKSQAVSAVDNKYKADFLRDVVTGRAGSSQRVASHARSLGWDVARRLAVLSIQLDVTGKDEDLSADELRELDDRLASAWQRAIRDHDPRAPAAGIRGEVIVLLPVGENDQAQIRGVVRTLAKRARSDRTGPNRSASVGISRATETIEDLPDAYQQAQRAVRAGRKLNGPRAVTDFDSLGVFRLLSLIPDDSELVAFAAETLGPLAGEPTPEYDDLLKTLTVLLEMGMNISKTARALHFHYNTLRYRIAKLERLLGPFTTDAHLRLRISLALEVREMRGI
jgi:purine catabolism regulator